MPINSEWAHHRMDDMGSLDAFQRACLLVPVTTVNGNQSPPSPRRPILQPPITAWALGVSALWAWLGARRGRAAGLERAAHTQSIIIFTRPAG